MRARLIDHCCRSQGYILVLIIGVATAVVAALLGRCERWFFDARDGHCLSGWRNNKEECPDWQTWSEYFDGRDVFLGDYALAILLSILFATVSALITVHLSSSASISSAKDVSASTLVQRSDIPAEKCSQTILGADKPMYFAAGSGIPEVKSIMGGFNIRGFLGWRTLITKSVGLALSVAR